MKTWLLFDEFFNEIWCFIPNGTSQRQAIKIAKKTLQEKGLKNGILQASYFRDDNIAYHININFNKKGYKITKY